MRRLIFLYSLFALELFAQSKGSLELRAHVPFTSKTSVSQFNVSSKEALIILSNQVNSDLFQETQKIEVEGIGQEGLEAHLEKIVTNERTIQYHVLINRMNSMAGNDRPIFLKISAN